MKISILIGIIVSMLLLASSAAASDFTLGVFGNANEDDTINMQDVTYTELIILEYRDRTELADGKYDGKINMQDVTQIELVILGKEKELTILDYDDVADTVDKPLDRVVGVFSYHDQAMRILGAEERIVGVDESVKERPTFFPELSKRPSIGGWGGYDFEAVLTLEPDVVIICTRQWTPDLEDKFEKDLGIQAIVIMPRNPDTLKQEMMKLGYVFNEEENARKYVEWYDDLEGELEETYSMIPEDERPRVFLEDHSGSTATARRISGHIMEWKEAGGINIAADLLSAEHKTADLEWIIEQNPDVIVGMDHLGEYETDDDSMAKAYYDEILGLPGFGNVNAVKNGRVHIISPELTRSCADPVGTAYLGKWFYPDIDMDPQAIHQEYMDEFCSGLNFDVYEHGVFVYPPLAES